jgi:hypothetical protein
LDFPTVGKPDPLVTKELLVTNEVNNLAAAPEKESASKDELFEAVAAGCGIDWTQLTKTGRGQLNAATKELRDIGATADQVGGKAAAYRKQYPEAALTPMALVKHWAGLDVTVKKPERPSVWDTYERPEFY